MTALDETRSRPAEDINLDLGFGAVVSRESRQRLLNRDGSFNVKRDGLSVWQELSPYHFLLTIGWPKFLTLVGIAYIASNTLFAFAYLACGHHALSGFSTATPLGRFWIAFFFSVETIATIGYGNIVPATLAANLLMTFESLFGILAFALIAGIVFGRFARPVALILFSEKAVIAPYRGITAFMFRIVNQRSSQIVDLNARVLLARLKDGTKTAEREFIPLKLERDRVALFPLSWTVVHPIDKDSPLRGYRTAADFENCDSEFLVLLDGFDETLSQDVHTRSSYKDDEIVVGARFKNIFNPPRPDGTISIDISRLHEIEPASLPG
ncbi:MAG TPA: ion channel [Thermoanaerobaculia bacterium]